MLVEKFTQVEQDVDSVSFYVVAHADDWQLFMHLHAFQDITSPRCKVVFIFTTAGDAGMDKKFWQAREEGTNSSVRFCLAALGPLNESGGTRVFNGHTIHYCTINHTTTYFLRLPDGGLRGGGHSPAHFETFAKFKAGAINSITAIDQSATYQSREQLITVIETIIEYEKSNIAQAAINYLDPDTTINPNDHPDHIATGELLQQTDVIKGLQQFLFVGYSSCNHRKAVNKEALFYKTGMFAAYEKAVYDGSGYSTLKENPGLYIN